MSENDDCSMHTSIRDEPKKKQSFASATGPLLPI